MSSSEGFKLPDNLPLEALSTERKGAFLDLCQELHELGENKPLQLAVFGSLIKGDFDPFHSDINLLIIFKSLEIKDLKRLSPVIKKGRREAGISPILMTKKEASRSADVFSSKFLDIRNFHIPVWGGEVLADIKIHYEHLRLRLEQEFRNRLMRARLFYLHHFDKEDFLLERLTEDFQGFLHSMNALIYLKTGEMKKSKKGIVKETAELLEVDLQIFLNIELGGKENAGENIVALLGVLEKAARAADLHDPVLEK